MVRARKSVRCPVLPTARNTMRIPFEYAEEELQVNRVRRARLAIAPRLLLLLLLALQSAPNAAAASDSHSVSGSYPGRVLTELGLHRQSVMQRARAGYLPQSAPPSSAADVGNIAVLADDGTLLTVANRF